jgi:hypothetical protein
MVEEYMQTYRCRCRYEKVLGEPAWMGEFGKFTCNDYDCIKTIHNRQGPSLFNLSSIPSLTLVKPTIPSRSHVILALTQHRQLVADVV